MEITIKGTSTEIANLVAELQGRPYDNYSADEFASCASSFLTNALANIDFNKAKFDAMEST